MSESHPPTPGHHDTYSHWHWHSRIISGCDPTANVRSRAALANHEHSRTRASERNIMILRLVTFLVRQRVSMMMFVVPSTGSLKPVRIDQVLTTESESFGAVDQYIFDAMSTVQTSTLTHLTKHSSCRCIAAYCRSQKLTTIVLHAKPETIICLIFASSNRMFQPEYST